MTPHRFLTVTVLTGEPWEFPGFAIVGKGAGLCTELQRVYFTDELADDLYDSLIQYADKVTIEEGHPKRRRDD